MRRRVVQNKSYNDKLAEESYMGLRTFFRRNRLESQVEGKACSPPDEMSTPDDAATRRIYPGEIYALLCVFTPAMVEHDGEPILGMRALLCLDVGGRKVIHQGSIPRQPSYITARDLISFLDSALSEHKKPKECFICGTCWMPSSDLPEYLAHTEGTFMETHSSFVRTLEDAGIHFSEMPKLEEEKLSAWLRQAEIEPRFGEFRDIEHEVGEFVYQDFRRKYVKS